MKRQAASSGSQDRVVFAGYIPDEELIAYYDACDVFTMPSTDRSEAFGLVQLEAMHLGKPVVSTRLGTGVEFVNLENETGLLVPPGDAPALRAAIERLLFDAALRRRLGEAGKARVASTFSVAQMVQGTLELYRNILAPGAYRYGAISVLYVAGIVIVGILLALVSLWTWRAGRREEPAL